MIILAGSQPLTATVEAWIVRWPDCQHRGSNSSASLLGPRIHSCSNRSRIKIQKNIRTIPSNHSPLSAPKMIQLGVGAHGARNTELPKVGKKKVSRALLQLGTTPASCLQRFLLVAFWALRNQRRIMQALTPTDTNRHKTLHVANAQRYLQQTNDGMATVEIYQEEAPVGMALLIVYKQIYLQLG